MSVRLITGSVECTYVHVDQPHSFAGDKKSPSFSITVLVDKKDQATLEAIRLAYEKAVEKKSGMLQQFPLCLYDGAYPNPVSHKPYPPEYADYKVLTAKTKFAVDVFDANAEPLDAKEIQPGDVVRLELSVFAYNQAGGRGANFGLESVQLVKKNGTTLKRSKSACAFQPLIQPVGGSPATAVAEEEEDFLA